MGTGRVAVGTGNGRVLPISSERVCDRRMHAPVEPNQGGSLLIGLLCRRNVGAQLIEHPQRRTARHSPIGATLAGMPDMLWMSRLVA